MLAFPHQLGQGFQLIKQHGRQVHAAGLVEVTLEVPTVVGVYAPADDQLGWLLRVPHEALHHLDLEMVDPSRWCWRGSAWNASHEGIEMVIELNILVFPRF